MLGRSPSHVYLNTKLGIVASRFFLYEYIV